MIREVIDMLRQRHEARADLDAAKRNLAAVQEWRASGVIEDVIRRAAESPDGVASATGEFNDSHYFIQAGSPEPGPEVAEQ